MSDLVTAVLRDASFYQRLRNPSPNDPARHYHVTRDSGQTTACGRLGAEFTLETDIAQIPVHRRCRRPGCRQAWPEEPHTAAEEPRA